MAAEDVPAVLRIEATWRGPRRGDELRALLDAPRAWCCVAEGAEGAVIGYLLARIVADEVELHDVAVDPAARRAGAGRALIGALVAWATAERAAVVFLEVRRGNQAAQALYRGFGFSEVGRRRRYYPDGEDALIFSASLPSASSADSAAGPG